MPNRHNLAKPDTSQPAENTEISTACELITRDPVGKRQTRRDIGDREADRDLAVVLLAELTAILPRDPDRMPAFLGKSGVVDDPRLNWPMPLDQRQHQVANPRQERLVRPRRLADEMQERLMLGRYPRWRRHRSQRLDTLPLHR